MEEMEGAGQPQRKGTKEATIHCGKILRSCSQGWASGEAKDPTPPPGSVLVATAIDCHSPGEPSPNPPPPVYSSLFIARI